VKITSNPAKRQATLADRGLDFNDAAFVFADRTIEFEDLRKPYPERRFVSVGHLHGRMVIVVWTPTPQGRHVISMRKCNDREQTKYGVRFDGE
jgi:uncharacterized DUF497 family protein